MTITVKQLAELLQVKRNTIYRWLEIGELPQPFRVGRSVRWLDTTIATWLAERQEDATTSTQ
ncbi:helix-turn-helix transcriptional regulator [Aeoliella mucimassa]|uniref:Helix-turn-helix domain protein n=1 Tax=Aeoliella mucimassa TaxID=2527972 RepID=A0A518AMG8_9BACT|nr:Helix-turn-helix domain protein [Aeoliella mucimassa]